MNNIKVKALVLMILAFLTFSAVSYSQDDSKQYSGKNKTPEEFAKKRTDRLNQELSLSEDQYKKVYDLMLTKASERKANKEKYKNLEKTERKELKKQSRENFMKQMQGILTQEQISKLEKMKANKKDKHRNKNKNGKQTR
ncbi:MAG: hypothetical protein IPM96_17800 [Ignavibacteria bacterium]|nr:hypothetical protein [Ignavibacteria bacterium]